MKKIDKNSLYTDMVFLTEQGVNYSLHLPQVKTDYIQKKICESNRPYEVEMLEDMYGRLDEGDCVLDVGANIGNHTLYLSAVVGCDVYAFEPNDILCEAIFKSRKDNELTSKIKIENVAVGEKVGLGHFANYNDKNLGAQRIDAGSEDVDSIKIVTLDSLQCDKKVRCIKIDVEGMELSVLKGGELVIRKDLPLLYVECQAERDFDQIYDFLSGFGYCYWTTFNATPTHLFIHSSEINQKLQVNHILVKSVREDYRTAKLITELRQKLNEANKKYRSSNELIAELKSKLEKANIKYRTSSEQVVALKESLKKLEYSDKVYTQNQLEMGGDTKKLQEKITSQIDSLWSMQLQNVDLIEENNQLYSRLTREAKQLGLLEDKLLDANRKQIAAESKLSKATQELNQAKLEKLSVDKDREDLISQNRSIKVDLKEAKLAEKKSKKVIQSVRIKNHSALEKNNTLSNQLSQASAQLDELRKESDAKLELMKKNIEELTKKNTIYLEKIGFRDECLKTREEEVSLLNKNIEKLERKKWQYVERYKNSRRKLKEMRREVDRLKLKSENMYISIKKYEELRSKLHEANKKYRQATGHEIPALKDRISKYAFTTKEVNRRLNRALLQLENLLEEKSNIELQLIKLKSSTTFKTGNLIRKLSRSPVGILKIPYGLAKLYWQTKYKPHLKVNKPIAGKEKPSPNFNVGRYDTPAPETIKDKRHKSLLLPENYIARELRVACIMDDFTYASYCNECDLQQLTPMRWKEELDSFMPELLFIESAWRGKDELWGGKVGHCSDETQGVIEWCKSHKVPTVFWNKEDPIHFETFLNTAKLFDYVFTTDLDCIHRYKAALGHEHVYLLPFACQPVKHNPIEMYKRKDAFCFAGAYYTRYPNRTRDLESYISELPKYCPIEIYDRNYGKDHPDYMFPPEYQPYIVGTLPVGEIDKAYKGYKYAINLNSIKQSQSMFARRVLELLASNTLTVSNYSRGVRLLFGDLVITSDNGHEVTSRLDGLNDGSLKKDKIRLAALRKVMLEHTYSNRLGYIAEKVFGQENRNNLPSVVVVSPVGSFNELKNITQLVCEQTHKPEILIFVCKENIDACKVKDFLRETDLNTLLVSDRDVQGKAIQDCLVSCDWVTGFIPQDYYGPNYLLDIVLSTRYSQAKVIGKSANYQRNNDKITLINECESYCAVDIVPMRMAAVKYDQIKRLGFEKWLADLETGGYEFENQLAIDPFNYCQNSYLDTTFNKNDTGLIKKIKATVNDLECDTGLKMTDLWRVSESIRPSSNVPVQENHSLLSPEFYDLLGRKGSANVSLQLSNDHLLINSSLEDGRHEYFYAKKDTPINKLERLLEHDNKLKIYFDVEPGLNLQLVIFYLTELGQKINHVILMSNKNHTIELPDNTQFIRFGLRVYSGGQGEIKSIEFSHRDLQPSYVFGKSDTLLVTNHYPSYDDLYRNGFVHSRVSAYHENNVKVDVFRLRSDQPISWHEFQDIDVTTGSKDALKLMLISKRYRSVLVHFLDANMWQVLKEFVNDIKINIWIHGAEVHPWWRRKYNCVTDDQFGKAKKESNVRMDFWKEVFGCRSENIHFVFVSKSFANEVFEDYNLQLDQDRYTVIHNPIDTNRFKYIEKPITQRKKILSIRPFATRQYANDISVNTIIELSKDEAFFKTLEFRIIGRGELFEETLEPIRKFSNVTIEERFLTQQEISSIHKDYGIFLCPTRWDSQGVSRDEAMASGLIPATNLVAAVGEFVDDDCGILAHAEDHKGLAEGIKSLFESPKKFLDMSKNAAKKVELLSGKDEVIKLEMKLFK